MTQNYRFYLMLGQQILQGEDVACVDDQDASAAAERLLETSDPAFDAIEAWRGTIRVCRHERVRQPHRP
jgi:hypothetical protein